jgi:hypothetical protein
MAKTLFAEPKKDPRDTKLKKKYQEPDGQFKKVKPPGGGDANRFEGCVQFFMKSKGMPRENAEKLCGYIKSRKGGCCGNVMGYEEYYDRYVAARVAKLARRLAAQD